MNKNTAIIATRGLEDIDTPAVLIDMDIVTHNIKRAAKICKTQKIAFRPHIKTHKITDIAKMQIQNGAVGITCQKLSEAEVMAFAGMQDILITYNIVGDKKTAHLRQLATHLNRLQVVADSEAVVVGLAAAFADALVPLPVLVECDTGAKRCGVQSPEAAAQLAARIATLPGLAFVGLMTYPPPHQTDVVATWLLRARDLCLKNGLPCDIVSNGGTPDLPRLTASSVVTEYRAGTYVYNDRAMVAHQCCQLQDCAMTILTTVVSTPAPGRAIVDAGSKIFSSDLLGLADYGEVQNAPNIRLSALSEEHGHLTLPPDTQLGIGDRLRIIPNHACVVSNLVDKVVAIRHNAPAEFLQVTARGHTI